MRDPDDHAPVFFDVASDHLFHLDVHPKTTREGFLLEVGDDRVWYIQTLSINVSCVVKEYLSANTDLLRLLVQAAVHEVLLHAFEMGLSSFYSGSDVERQNVEAGELERFLLTLLQMHVTRAKVKLAQPFHEHVIQLLIRIIKALKESSEALLSMSPRTEQCHQS
ncbi:hypothetical protein P3T76_011524 [Phytophthora citrophthora]|uniref:Uncharacterized protein n=1 Tax=Phytophthora citrophthora TaxID=4793 RepID=A0AAD9G9F6_9STRA|nr:hypothetical protein P3T76_011524 [Phytophthora citrophthora]